MRANTEGAMARDAVKGISSKNPLQPRRSMLKSGKAKKEKPAKPLKVKSTRIVDETEEKLPPRNVKSTRVSTEEPQKSSPKAIESSPKAIAAPPAKKASKPRKPRDVKYTQPTLPGMRNKAQFRGKNGKD